MTKTLLLDIETAPELGYTWGKWEQDVIDFKKHGYMLSFSYKWLGDKDISTVSLPCFTHYRKDKEDDRELVKELWLLLDEADIVVAHNGDRFDLPYANMRFIKHGLTPPTPYKTVDTLKIAKTKLKLVSNKLDDIGRYFDIGRKLAHTGSKLWFDCMAGDKKAWALMEKYNEQDIVLLEEVYMKLRPWSTTHPNVNLVDMKVRACPTCGKQKLQRRGEYPTRVAVYQRFQCRARDCGAWSKGLLVDKLEIK